MPLDLNIAHVMFLIFAGTAVLSTLALFTRQSLLVAYIVLGALFGPYGLGFINNPTHCSRRVISVSSSCCFCWGSIAAAKPFHSLRKMSVITVVSSVLFFLIGFGVAKAFCYTLHESMIIGIAAMFSSTIIGIKLLPTTMLHHQHTGELMISILLLQDIIAIIVIFTLEVIAKNRARLIILSG